MHIVKDRKEALTKYVVTVKSTSSLDTFRAVAMVSIAGKYMLDDNGEKKEAREATATIALLSFTVNTENLSWPVSASRHGCSSAF